MKKEEREVRISNRHNTVNVCLYSDNPFESIECNIEVKPPKAKQLFY